MREPRPAAAAVRVRGARQPRGSPDRPHGLEERGGEAEKLSADPGKCHREGEQRGTQPRDHRQRRLLDLGDGLEQSHPHAHDQACEDRRHRGEDHQHQGLAADGQQRLGAHPRYPCTRLRARSAQPSTATKRSTLKGRLTCDGDSDCMPSARRTLATTMSTTRNGRKMRKPIWNACFSSERTKAGATTARSLSSTSTPPWSSRESAANSARSSGLPCARRKARSGSAATRTTRSISGPGVAGIRSAWTRASIASATGLITTSESTADRPVSTTVGGACCVPSAERVSERTTLVLVKLVNITMRKGNRLIPASSSSKDTGLGPASGSEKAARSTGAPVTRLPPAAERRRFPRWRPGTAVRRSPPARSSAAVPPGLARVRAGTAPRREWKRWGEPRAPAHRHQPARPRRRPAGSARARPASAERPPARAAARAGAGRGQRAPDVPRSRKELQNPRGDLALHLHQLGTSDPAIASSQENRVSRADSQGKDGAGLERADLGQGKREWGELPRALGP